MWAFHARIQALRSRAHQRRRCRCRREGSQDPRRQAAWGPSRSLPGLRTAWLPSSFYCAGPDLPREEPCRLTPSLPGAGADTPPPPWFPCERAARPPLQRPGSSAGRAPTHPNRGRPTTPRPPRLPPALLPWQPVISAASQAPLAAGPPTLQPAISRCSLIACPGPASSGFPQCLPSLPAE